MLLNWDQMAGGTVRVKQINAIVTAMIFGDLVDDWPFDECLSEAMDLLDIWEAEDPTGWPDASTYYLSCRFFGGPEAEIVGLGQLDHCQKITQKITTLMRLRDWPGEMLVQLVETD